MATNKIPALVPVEYTDIGEGLPVFNGPKSFEQATGSNGVPGSSFGSAEAEGYVISLLERFDDRHPDAARELRFILNQAKWAVGWKSFCRSAEELLG